MGLRVASGTSCRLGLVRVLAPGARAVAESDRRAPVELDALELLDERRYGDTLIRIFNVPTG